MHQLDQSPESRYHRAIEDVFIDLRGSPLQLSPKDYQTAKEWYRQGIPLELVEQTVREIFARREAKQDEEEKSTKVWGLTYCKRAVVGAWRRQQKLQAAGVATDDEELDLTSRLENLAMSLPEDLAGRDAWAQKIRALQGDAEQLEQQLAQLDQDALRQATDALESAEALAIEQELATSRAALAGRLPTEELERAGDRLREEILRRRLGLPVLSLFAPEALEAKIVDG